MSVLEAQGVTVVRGGRAIVDDVSLTMAAGQFVGLIGPNGAGKSTLMAALAGLLRVDSGAVRIDGAAVQSLDRRALARTRAYLPQNPRAEWPVSVERLVALGLTPQLPAFGSLPAEMQARVAAVIEAVDLAEHRDQPATTLSGGELARAMLARAMVGDPTVLLVDEPLAGLDPRHALDGIARLRRLADGGKLVLAAMHELTLAARCTTHIAVMHEGRLVAFGPTAETLTAELLREVFEVDACVSRPGTPGATVDFVPSNSEA
jgi:iron complex transport system ATP-binding protein